MDIHGSLSCFMVMRDGNLCGRSVVESTRKKSFRPPHNILFRLMLYRYGGRVVDFQNIACA